MFLQTAPINRGYFKKRFKAFCLLVFSPEGWVKMGILKNVFQAFCFKLFASTSQHNFVKKC